METTLAGEAFSTEERRLLEPHFTNLDSHVFALTNLPETVKGALFARYSRSSKSLRRLFLDEFADKVHPQAPRPEQVKLLNYDLYKYASDETRAKMLERFEEIRKLPK